MPRTQKQWGRGEKACLAATVFAGAVLFVAPLWWRSLDADVPIIIEPTTLPKHNAWTWYQKALNAQVRPEVAGLLWAQTNSSVVSLRTLSPSEKVSLKHDVARLAKSKNSFSNLKHRSRAKRILYLRANRQALRHIRQGLQHPNVLPGVTQMEVDKIYENANPLFYLLMLDARTKAINEDWNDAAQACVDAVHFAHSLRGGANVAAARFSFQLENSAMRVLWKTISRLSPATLKAVQMRLAKIRAQSVAWDRVLEEEKRSGLRRFKVAFAQSNWRRELMRDSPYSPNITSLEWTSKRQVVETYVRAIDIQIREARQPYRATSDTSSHEVVYERQFFNPNFRAMRSVVLRNEAQILMLQTSLALWRWKKQNGSFPTRLNQLVPRYLPQVPHDPFAPSRPLVYRPFAKVFHGQPTRGWSRKRIKYAKPFTLYSVGTNARDDGGKIVDHMDELADLY